MTIIGQTRELERHEKTYRYGFLRETYYYKKGGYNDAEITWSDSTTLKVIQYAHSLTYMSGCILDCDFVELRKYPNDSTYIHVTMNKNRKTVKKTFINGKLRTKEKLNKNAGFGEIYDPVRGYDGIPLH